jgi:hypothetical protein
MEYPIYKVAQSTGHAAHIQKMDSMNSGSEWHEVVHNGKHWSLAGERSWLGFTKAEAIADLLNRFSLTVKQ